MKGKIIGFIKNYKIAIILGIFLAVISSFSVADYSKKCNVLKEKTKVLNEKLVELGNYDEVQIAEEQFDIITKEHENLKKQVKLREEELKAVKGVSNIKGLYEDSDKELDKK